MGSKTYTTVTVFVHHFTDGAIKASDDGVEHNAVWCPRSFLDDWTPRLGTQDIDIEEWKAGDLGWT